MIRRLIIFILVWAVLLATVGHLPAQAASLTETTKIIEKNHLAKMQMADHEQALAVCFCSAAETWAAVAGHLARQLDADDALTFLEKAQHVYQLHQARLDTPVTVQLAGLNLLYQSMDTMASLLARKNQDAPAQQLIADTESKLLSVVGQSGGSQPGPVMAALSGGIMTMLAVVNGQLDSQGVMRNILATETQRRRQIDANIYNLKDSTPDLQILMLTNNHLFGALSMLQIIGLLQDPDLKPQLRQIEEKLIGLANDSPDKQLPAGAQAMVEAGFLVAPTFDNYK